MKRMSMGLVLVVLCLCGSGCTNEHKVNAKPTVPVKGKILVDGQPVSLVTVNCMPAQGVDKSNPTLSSAMTDAEGKFALATYKAGDGVPEGDYVLTFTWGELGSFKHTSANASEGDKLNGRYSDPKQSTTKFSAKVGKPVDLGEIKLTTKPE
ncbi:MAG: hypothetical protein JSS02_12200 [Planctomycetes bacterium]|nr:hypothetical protein [Planctomycetota bacterium]